MNTIVVNLFGEPSAGKSTAAMDITARLKRNCDENIRITVGEYN